MRRRTRASIAGVLMVALGATGMYARDRCAPYERGCAEIADYFEKEKGERYALWFLVLCLETHDCLNLY